MERAYLPVLLGHAWVALDAQVVEQVMGSEPWQPIVGLPLHLRGLLRFRGRAIVVLDLAALMGIETPLIQAQSRPRVVVAKTSDHSCAIPADAVREVRVAEVRPIATRTPYASSEVLVDGTPFALVDLGRVMKSVVQGAA